MYHNKARKAKSRVLRKPRYLGAADTVEVIAVTAAILRDGTAGKSSPQKSIDRDCGCVFRSDTRKNTTETWGRGERIQVRFENDDWCGSK